MRKPLEKDDFDFKMGSKIWPSDDPEDSPIDTYICRYCGFEINYQGCGAFLKGQMEAEYNSAKMRKMKHRLECKKWPVIEQGINNELVVEKMDTIIDLLRIITDKKVF